MNNPRKMVAIFAHPDDEAFGTGGTLAKYAAEGVEVHLIMATRGEAGQSANPDIIATQPVGLLREKELRDACNCYGLAELHLLGYLDGQTAIVPPSEPVFKIVEILRRLKPQVALSFGPDGVYGHFDHLVVHRWAAAAVELAADPHKWPEAGPAYQVTKFYHRALPQPQVERMVELNGRATVDMGGVPFPFVGYQPEQITTVIDVRKYARTKLAAIMCHRSQIFPDFVGNQPDFDPAAAENNWFWQETYILANRNGYGLPETDLFTGVK